MKKIAIMAEKPGITRSIAPFARRHWPDAHITFVHVVPYGNFRFSYPRGLKRNEFPYLSEPRHKLASWVEWLCKPVVYGTGDTPVTVDMTPDLLTEADLIVNACDPDHTGAVSFDILLNQVFGDDRAKDCPSLYLMAMDAKSIETGFANLSPFGEVFASAAAYGHAKRYFEWNWNVNALAILAETEKHVGVPADAPPVSKYALQLLYGLRGCEPVTEGKVLDLMQRWPGAGRYKPARGAWRPRLGSCASCSLIVENLLKAGLLEKADDKLLGLSARGQSFLAALHPDCKDLDLPFRLDAWCAQGVASKPAMDRYLRTFFGKQIRYRSKVSSR